MAVGAGRANILGIVFRYGLLLTAGGMLVGVGGALVITRLLTHLLFQVSPFDMTSFVSSLVLLEQSRSPHFSSPLFAQQV